MSNEDKMKEHSQTCTCEDCGNKSKLSQMAWWVFWEHRGYMQDPESFDTYEKALEFAKEEGKGFHMPYIVFGYVARSPSFKQKEDNNDNA